MDLIEYLLDESSDMSMGDVCILNEYSLKKLVNQTDNGRRTRADRQVRTNPPRVTDYGDYEMLHYNFKAYPSREQKRHKGYMIHNHGDVQQVFCDCKDFLFRLYYVLEKGEMATYDLPKEYQRLLPHSFKAEPPEITNTQNEIFLCKHLLALKRYVNEK